MLSLSVPGPVELWWPAGYGAQRRYEITAKFTPLTPLNGATRSTPDAAIPSPPDVATPSTPVDVNPSTPGEATSAADGAHTHAPPASDGGTRRSVPNRCGANNGDSRSGGGGGSSGATSPPPPSIDARSGASHITRCIGFRTIELMRRPLADAFEDLSPDGLGWQLHSRATSGGGDSGRGSGGGPQKAADGFEDSDGDKTALRRSLSDRLASAALQHGGGSADADGNGGTLEGAAPSQFAGRMGKKLLPRAWLRCTVPRFSSAPAVNGNCCTDGSKYLASHVMAHFT
eukprot:364291-Chlamydomonas_euryale.AAC.1